MLGAFFDDSGTHGDSPAVVMGGLLGTDRQWDDFAQRWQGLLEEPLPGKPPLSQFHLYSCRRGQGEFIDYKPAERDHLTHLFRRIIIDRGFVTLASAVDKAAWDELVVGEIAEQLGDPLGYCFFKCVELVVSTIRFRRTPGEPVHMFLDEGSYHRVEDMAALFRMQKGLYPEIAGIAPAPVKAVIALQGADMIAYETFLYNIEWKKHGEAAVANAHFKEYLQRELSAGLFLNREGVEEMVGRVRETLAQASCAELPALFY
jgi:hypothetical protein